MKNQNVRKKTFAVLKAAIMGAVLFDALALISSVILKHTQSGFFWNDIAKIIAFILIMPVMSILNFFGLQNMAEGINGYIVYTLCGALIFTILALAWQFVFKRTHEK